MTGFKTSLIAPAILSAALFFSGCTSVTSTSSTKRGKLIRTDHVSVWPLFMAQKSFYDNGTSSQGSAILIVNWNVWKQKKGSDIEALSGDIEAADCENVTDAQPIVTDAQPVAADPANSLAQAPTLDTEAALEK